MIQEQIYFKSAGVELAGSIDFPAKLPAPAVIFCHGYTNTKEDCPLFGAIKERLLASGCIVFRFDQFGSGDSPGEFKEKLTSILAQNAQDALDFLVKDKRVVKGKIGMIGISTGGVLLTLMGDDSRIKTSVMISPSFNLVREFAGERATLDSSGYAKLACDPQTKKSSTGKTKGDLVMSKQFFDELPEMDLRAIRVLPRMKNVLILFGSDDRLVKPICGQEIIDLVGDPKQLCLIPDAGHNCSRKPEIAVKSATDWLLNYLQ